ncbi:MAG: DUF5752 family protein [Alphaproteobacteria bacterium]|uniref:DUF5752 family protein n=1 Tax=Candidatus Nitrobium versatile TaxID=2884831 RepID=A0A953JF98_9BACT|nr:DUF5752 family protein [Candidatus Nitrobium versatile]
MEGTREFEFKQSVSILKSTGRKAKNLGELRDNIAEVSPASLFHHTYQYFLKGHILEYTNDFAHWAGESIEERSLSEHLSNIDPYSCRNIDELRTELLRVIDRYRENFPEPREALPGEEFYFNETVTLTFLAGIRVRNLAEFLMAVRYADTASLYYHFYEARVRTGRDDFSRWTEEALGLGELARTIEGIDPFMHHIEGIREHIVEAVEETVRRGMEVIAP